MESKAKRMRTASWDSSDKIILGQLIEEQIENKNVDTNNSRKKNSFHQRNLQATGGDNKLMALIRQEFNCKDDEHLKKELFNTAMANRRAETKFMEREHKEKIKSILMERNEKIKTLQMERAEKEKTLQMERRHKEEIHQLKMRKLEEHFHF